MKFGRVIAVILFFGVAATLRAQDAGLPQAPPEQSNTIIRAEKRLVLVDAVVTDKKGNYIHDLTLKDFRVWEDKKEVSLESFSFGADPASSQTRKHYAVLFFDNSTMSAAEQIQARRAALKFLDANTGSNRLMAVVDFGGTLRIAQNFTEDAQRLKQVVGGVKFSAVSPNGDIASAGGTPLSYAAAQFGARDVLLAIRDLAKGLSTVPGRKTLIFLSAGFGLDNELRSELTAVIDLCNKANVAVYPIDVRGLIAALNIPPAVPDSSPYLRPVAFVQQRGVGGPTSGGGGRTGGGNTGGGRGGNGGRAGTGNIGSAATRGAPGMGSPYGQPRSIVPPLLPNVSKNQEVLYALATGTGGFVIVNTNDLLGGLEKIGNEQNEYYVLGYSPPDEGQGECHELKVKVDRGGTNVRARTGYCTSKPLDLLAGTRTEKDLETRAQAGAGGNVPASMSLPFFYTSPNTARVDIALEIPSTALKFAKEKGKLHSEMNVLGIATEADGTVAARFSDTVKLDLDDKKQLQQFEQTPYHYENQFDLGSGQYTLKVVFSSGGESFGKVQMPLAIDPYDSKKFGLSGVALSKNIQKVSDLTLGLDSALLEDRKPLVSQGFELAPSGSNNFDRAHPAAAYVEIYEPLLLEANAPKIGLQMKIIDRKTGEQKIDTGFVNVGDYTKTGNAVVPVALRLPLDKLTAGAFRAQFKAADSAGNASVTRSVDFDVQ